jgi:hypothetical protein
MVILIPYNVKYWTLYVEIAWRKDLTNERRYLNLFSIISGRKNDPIRMQSYAYLSSSGKVVTGSYSSSPGLVKEAKDYSYWASQYDDAIGFGAALFLSKSALNLAENLFNDKTYLKYINYKGCKESNNPDELFIFTSYDYSRRALYVLPHCWCTGSFGSCTLLGGAVCGGECRFDIKAGLQYSYKTAAWIYDGGYNEPSIYYKMFVDMDSTNPAVQKVYVPGFS